MMSMLYKNQNLYRENSEQILSYIHHTDFTDSIQCNNSVNKIIIVIEPRIFQSVSNICYGYGAVYLWTNAQNIMLTHLLPL